MSEATRWWWIRHAPVTTHQGVVYGSCDHPCDTDDPQTFEGLARALPSGAVWITSNLVRTHQTADAIAKHLKNGEGQTRTIEAGLSEQSFGDWHGMTHEELRLHRKGEWHRFWLAPASERPPGGESFIDVVTRVKETVTRLSRAHAGRDIVAVAHGGTIRAAIAIALAANPEMAAEMAPEMALAFSVDNCALTRIDHIAGGLGTHDPASDTSWRLALVNAHPKHFL